MVKTKKVNKNSIENFEEDIRLIIDYLVLNYKNIKIDH